MTIKEGQKQGVKKTTRRTQRKSVQKVVIKPTSSQTKEEKLATEVQLRIEIAQFINEAQGKLNQLIELQRELNTSDRSRFCKLERALRRNMSYTNLKTFVNA